MGVFSGQVENALLFISAKHSVSGAGMEVKIKCEKMELAADLIQDMAKFMQITELESIADFPDEISAFAEVTIFIYF